MVRARERKADWIQEQLHLAAGATVLDLGCGDGILDLVLAKRGFRVTAVDRIASVIEAARAEAAEMGVEVEFVAGDLRTHQYRSNYYDAAVLFDTVGLMGEEEETRLLRAVRNSLKPCAMLALDWPAAPRSAAWERTFPDGVLRVQASFEEATRVQTILPEFHTRDSRIVQLHDPLSAPSYPGIRRHIYTVAEMQDRLGAAGYRSQEVPHYRANDYHMLIASQG